MLAYLNNEVNFLRAFGTRCLLLVFLCALSRTGAGIPHASALGLTIDLNPGVIAIVGAPLALLLLYSLKLEADSLRMARLAILSELVDLHRVAKYKPGAIYLLFCVPFGCAVFLFIQYVLKVTLVSRTCGDWLWHFIDWGSRFGASKYCIGDKTEGMPWIYAPWQTYGYLVVIAVMVFVTYRMAKEWTQYRGPESQRTEAESEA
jgi:hypothetical protein